MDAVFEFFTALVLIKILLAVSMVVLISIFAEIVSPRFAGILAGYPMGAAISLFFMGYDISPRFAAESALYTTMGLIATQVFAYGYYRSSLIAGKMGKELQVLVAALGGVAAYFIAAALLHLIKVNAALAVALPGLSILLFMRLFRKVKDARIEQKAGMGLKALALRAVFAGATIVAITSLAETIGARWAGLFAAFPMTMLPSVVIIHFKYDPEHAHAFLKHVPKGLGCLILYTLSLWLSYPAYGIYVGTVLSYALATVYLFAVQAGMPAFIHARMGEGAKTPNLS